jgi:uncharacterized damage-inducible protein DinB
MDLAGHLRIQAHANALANERLGAALAGLSDDDWRAPRTGFFPSLAGTLNHVLAVDLYYIAALHRDRDPPAAYDRFVPHPGVAGWRAEQRASDLRLVAFCDALDAAAIDAVVDLPRRDHVQRERVGQVLAHLFAHQVHHRGQAHAMLSATAVKPPQLDEFLMPSEAHLRGAEMRAFGWDERAVYGATV